MSCIHLCTVIIETYLSNRSNNTLMKNKLIKFLSLSLLIGGISFSASSQVYVTIRPSAPVIVRPPQPSHTHVWISNEWEPEGKSYRYSGGHWAAPPHGGDVYYQGRWKHGKKGHVWVPGGWKKRK